MSRRTKWSPDRKQEVAFGHDHACGWFLQVFDHSDPDNKDEVMLVSADETSFTEGKCNREIIQVKALEYGVTISDEELDVCQNLTPRRPLAPWQQKAFDALKELAED